MILGRVIKLEIQEKDLTLCRGRERSGDSIREKRLQEGKMFEGVTKGEQVVE